MTRTAWAPGAKIFARGARSRPVLATKPSIGRNACLSGTTNGTPWETRALRYLASICATIATGLLARAETWETILLSSGRDASRSTSAAMKPTPLQEHRR